MPTTEFDPASPSRPLTDADIDDLASLLAADWAPEATMDIEQLDGFLAGLVCAPRMVMPSSFLPAIFGDGEPAFPDAATAQRFLDLLMRRHNQVAEALNAPVERLDDPRAYAPLLIDWPSNEDLERPTDESGEPLPLPRYGELWARGFMRAVLLSEEDWEEVPEGDDEGADLVDDALAAIIALVPDDDDEHEAATAEADGDRDGLVAEALAAAYDLRDYWREVQFEQVRVKEPIRREPKVGRNDPCPCGSGRKFKQCHGRGQ
jgi:uncharacterized protein